MKKKLFTSIILAMFVFLCSNAQCLKCNNGKNGNKGQVSMTKSNYPDPGYENACVPQSKVKQYQSEGWFVCYDGPFFIARQAIPVIHSLNHSKNNSDSLAIVKVSLVNSVMPKCNCNCSLPNYGLRDNQLKNCLSYCYRICELGW